MCVLIIKHMKYYYFLLISFLVSCNNDLLLDKDPTSTISTKSSNIYRASSQNSDSSAFDWTGILVNIYPIKGIIGERKYLSSRMDGEVVDLFDKDDNSGRQRWILSKLSDGTYNVSIYSGISNSKYLLSSRDDGKRVDLWNIDDESGRQRWNFVPLGDDVYSILIKSGITNTRKYLSCTYDGKKVDLYDVDDNSGRQRWKIEAVDDFDLVDIKYSLSPEDVVKTVPSFLSTVYYDNSTSLQQSMTVHFSNKAVESSSFSQSYGISIKNSASFKVSVLAMDASMSTEITTSASWSLGGTTTQEDQRSYDFPIIIAPNSKYSITVDVTMCKLSANYEATFKSRTTHILKKIKGRWTGIQASRISYIIKDMTNNRMMKVPSNLKLSPVKFN